MTLYALLLWLCHFFFASRALLIHALYNFAGLVLREHMFEGHVIFERKFQKIVKLRKFRWSQCAVTSTPWAPGLSSLARIGGFRLKAGHCPCRGYILKLMCRCIEQPLLRYCLSDLIATLPQDLIFFTKKSRRSSHKLQSLSFQGGLSHFQHW